MMSRTIGDHISRRRQARTLAGTAAGLALLTAACGNGGANHAGSSSTPPLGYRHYLAYSRCMRSHGAPFWPDPSTVNQGVWDNPDTYKITAQILAEEHGPRWQAALGACRRLTPTAMPYTAAQISALRSDLEKLAACMRAHGISRFPMPTAGPYGAGFATLGHSVNLDSAQFLAAQRACWVNAPGSENGLHGR